MQSGRITYFVQIQMVRDICIMWKTKHTNKINCNGIKSVLILFKNRQKQLNTNTVNRVTNISLII